MAAAIEFSKVRKVYAGHVALAGVSLSVPDSQFVAPVGASGSGKTTLLKTANRLIAPDAGSVLTAGEDASRRPAAELRGRRLLARRWCLDWRSACRWRWPPVAARGCGGR